MKRGRKEKGKRSSETEKKQQIKTRKRVQRTQQQSRRKARSEKTRKKSGFELMCKRERNKRLNSPDQK